MRSAFPRFIPFLALLICNLAFAGNPDTSTSNTLPQQVSDAKKVYVDNREGSDVAFDAFVAAMKQWGRYQMVASPADAQVVFQFRYTQVVISQNIWQSKNMTNGAIETVKTDNTEGQLRLVMYDPKDRTVFGSITQDCKSARGDKKKERESLSGVTKLMQKLKDRVPPVSKKS